MPALVTGCAGFIGSHLCEALLARGTDVVGVDCFNDNYGRPAKLRNLRHAQDWDAFEFVPIDLARGDLQDLVDDCEVVYHLAAEPGVRSSWGARFEAYVRNNVVATQHLLEATRTQPERRFVYASSSSIYGQAEALPTPESTLPRPVSPYGATKLAAEHLCTLYHHNHGVQAVSLRYFSVYGPRQRPDMAFHAFCRAALERRPISVYGTGRQTRDFTFVHDVVTATLAAAESPAAPGGTYNVGGGSRVSVAEALALIEEMAGHPLDVRHLDAQPGDVRDTGADTAAAQRDLGYAPAQSFSDGLRAEFEWMAGEVAAAARG